jgi:endogenous inhibitor of DNA gyrase (YacG/DUF329 family)
MIGKLVRCPQCGKSVEYRTDNAARPFRSSRCKLLDLGAWAEERYAIGGSSCTAEEPVALADARALPSR